MIQLPGAVPQDAEAALEKGRTGVFLEDGRFSTSRSLGRCMLIAVAFSGLGCVHCLSSRFFIYNEEIMPSAQVRLLIGSE